MNIRTSVLFGLFAGGILLLALGFFTGPIQPQADSKDVRIVRLTGKVTLVGLGGKLQIVQNDERVIGNLSISTDATGTARVVFSESELNLNPNSWVDINTVSNEIIVKRGDFDIIRVTPEKKWTVTRSSQKYWLEDYNYNRVVEENQNKKGSFPNEKSIETQKSLIQTSILRQRSAFFKCYSLKLRRDPLTTQVQALIKIVVEPSGSISQTRVVSLTPQDNTFEECLIKVMERIQLPSFAGQAIETSVPFEFE